MIALGRIAVEAGGAEHRGRNEGRARNAGTGEDQEDRGHRQAHPAQKAQSIP